MTPGRRTWKRRILIASVLLVAVPVAGFLVITSRSAKAWHAFVERWEATGERFEPEHYAPKAMPDAENLARHPLFTGGNLEKLSTSPAYHAIEPTNLPNWSEDAFFTYLDDPETANLAPCFGLPKGTTGAALTDHLGETYQKWSGALDAFAAALEERGPFGFSLDWNAAFLDGENFPEVGALQSLGTSFMLRAAVRRASGDGSGAARDLVAILRLARALSPTPLLLTMVVEAGLVHRVLDELQAGLEERNYSEEELRTLATELDRLPSLVDGFHQALRMERALQLTVFDHLKQADQASALETLQNFGSGTGLSLFLIRAWMPANRLALCQDQQELFLGPGGQYAHLARLEAALSKRLDRPAERLIAPLAHLVLATTGAAASLGSVAFQTEASINHARIALALERHRRAHGAFPANLAELLPADLATLPLSSFDRGPIRYKLRPDGTYRLWQVVPGGSPPWDWEGQ